jgi:hypothetical protein
VISCPSRGEYSNATIVSRLQIYVEGVKNWPIKKNPVADLKNERGGNNSAPLALLDGANPRNFCDYIILIA